MVKLSKSQLRRLKKALRRESDPEMRQRIQIVVLRETGMTQPEITEVVGVSLSTVNRAHMAFDRGGLKALKPKPSGGRINENMTWDEEKVLLDRFAEEAGAGQMLNIDELKAAYEKAIGHPTSNSTVYALLARHGWRQVMPRPKRNIEAQENMFQRPCAKPKKAALARGHRLRVHR